MKRLVQSYDDRTVKIDVIFNVELVYQEGNDEIAAATYRGIEIPEGELLPAEKDAIVHSQAYRDYHSFIDSVEELLMDYYELEVYYKNESDYNSFYYGLLAKDNDNSLLFDFTLHLRVSTHEAHRTQESQRNKKKEKQALNQLSKGKKVRVISSNVIVNRDEFSSYIYAIGQVDDIVKDAIDVMTRRSGKKG